MDDPVDRGAAAHMIKHALVGFKSKGVLDGGASEIISETLSFGHFYPTRLMPVADCQSHFEVADLTINGDSKLIGPAPIETFLPHEEWSDEDEEMIEVYPDMPLGDCPKGGGISFEVINLGPPRQFKMAMAGYVVDVEESK